MKKLLFLAMLAVTVQLATAQTVRLGVKAGANLDKIEGTAFKDGYNLGYHVGLFSEIDFGALGVQPEVLFNQINTERAATFDAVLNNWQVKTGDIQLKYLSIPVLLRYNVTKLLTLNAGPQFGILLNKDDNLWNQGKQAIKSGDMSLVGGLSVNFSSLRVYGRYVIGLTNISDVQSQESWKSQQIQLGVGLKL